MGLIKHALKAISKAEAGANRSLPYDGVPEELLDARCLDLRVWSMLFSDASARNVAKKTKEREQKQIDAELALYPCEKFKDDSPCDADEARRFARKEAFWQSVEDERKKRVAKATKKAQEDLGVLEIIAPGASLLTDVGLAILAAACPRLTTVNFAGALRLTDVGLRALAKDCPLLTSLDLGGCVNLKGPGLAAVGSQCPLLKSIRLAGCAKAVTGPSLAALLKGTGRSLTHLDVSYCGLLTDGDCQSAIAKFCPYLISLSLQESKQVGDIGFVAIATHCPQLEKLSLARSDLKHRITDVGLLGLADGCGASLKELDLRGCEMVTDVGVAWIANQAAALEVIILRGCDRITNAGCRALAEQCVHLKKIDLRGAKRVSDVGVRVLGAGLKSLTHLDLSYMHMLTDGADRGFGFEGLLALAQDAPHLRGLHLDGCFQVSKRALNALGRGLHDLTQLGLAGCPKLTPPELGSLIKANPFLEQLNLAGCGDCVDDDMLTAVSKGATKLKHLVLRDCPRVGLPGIRALMRHCTRLQKLDLTGCEKMTDDALGLIGDVEFKPPGLRHLMLCHCRKVGDVGLAWLVEGSGGKDLITLNVLKTCCTTSGLTSYRDKFLHSEIKKETTFFGFCPRPRWEHRVIIHGHGERRDAAIKLAAVYRAKCARRGARRVKYLRELTECCTALQARWRGWKGRDRVMKIRQRIALEHAMATKIQSIHRRTIGQECANEQRRLKELQRAHVAANEIQRVWRGLLARRYVKDLIRRARERARRRKKALKYLQRIFRGWLAQAEVHRRYQERAALRIRERDAAVLIQRKYRVVVARAVTTILRQQRDDRNVAEINAAIAIQKKFRRNQTWTILDVRRKLKEKEIKAAILVQALWRCRRDALAVYIAAAERRKNKEHSAAGAIQRCERVRRALRELAHRKATHRKIKRARQLSALKLQAVSRGILGRIHAHRTKGDRLDRVAVLSQTRAWAATRLTAAYRGRKDRRRAMEKLDEKRARWKEMFDEDTHRPFFYNQMTGEIRWRRPQELLELMKRPLCDNCAYFDASVECNGCGEFFCNECWANVHYGGKRALHPFRALYDANGRRVDYGDAGSFESLWPSEILQDDINGILLRVSPHREPIETRGSWQRYEDNNGHSFYYNPISGDGTYETPDTFSNQLTAYQLAAGLSTGEYTLDHTSHSSFTGGPEGTMTTEDGHDY